MMEAACTSETSVDNYFTRQYIPEDKSELHTRRRENLKAHKKKIIRVGQFSENKNFIGGPIHLRFLGIFGLCLYFYYNAIRFWFRGLPCA
jgi:hypothetical protein